MRRSREVLKQACLLIFVLSTDTNMVTNLASSSLPVTYVRMRVECEKLLKIARQIESIALFKSNFNDDTDFMALKDEFAKVLQEVMPLHAC
jgi:hypothetical protein